MKHKNATNNIKKRGLHRSFTTGGKLGNFTHTHTQSQINITLLVIVQTHMTTVILTNSRNKSN